MYRTHLFIVQLFLLYALATLLVLIVVDQAGASAPAGAMGLLGGVLVGSSFTVLARYNSYLGFYEVDRHGQPLRYLGQEALPYLKHRLPVCRRTFLRAVAPQDQGARSCSAH